MTLILHPAYCARWCLCYVRSVQQALVYRELVQLNAYENRAYIRRHGHTFNRWDCCCCLHCAVVAYSEWLSWHGFPPRVPSYTLLHAQPSNSKWFKRLWRLVFGALKHALKPTGPSYQMLCSVLHCPSMIALNKGITLSNHAWIGVPTARSGFCYVLVVFPPSSRERTSIFLQSVYFLRILRIRALRSWFHDGPLEQANIPEICSTSFCVESKQWQAQHWSCVRFFQPVMEY